jgi:hypothetical protein
MKESKLYIRISKDKKAALKAKCEKEHRTISNVIHMWITQYLEGIKK